MRHRILRIALLTVALPPLLACGGGDEEGTPPPPETRDEACALVDGCDTPEMEVAGPREAIWRVRVVRDGTGDVRIDLVEEVDVAAAVGAPQGPLDAQHGLAALDAAGEPLDFQLLRFPETLVVEPLAFWEPAMEEDLTGREVDAVGYLTVSEQAERLVVVDAGGTEIASVGAPAPGEAIASEGTGASSEALVRPSTTSACGHVMLLEGGWDEIWFPAALADRYPLQEVTPTQYAVVKAALGRMPPMLCAGISRIAFVDLGSGTAGQVNAHAGDLVLLNAAVDYGDGLGFDELSLQAPGQRARLMHTIFHEGAHAAEWLLNSTAEVEGYAGEWEPSERDLAAETVDRVRLRGGLAREWRRVHGAFFGLGWADSYLIPPFDEVQREHIRGLGPAEMAEYGMMSMYATKQHHEDIADTVGWAMSAPLMREAGLPDGPPPLVNDYGCIAMRAHGEQSVPQDLSAVFTKLAFVRDLGLITPEVFDSCAGPNIGLEPDVEGITIVEEGDVQNTFTTDPEAIIGTLDDRYVFELTVHGTAQFGDESHAATLTLRIDLGGTTNSLGEAVPVEEVPWPRGIYSLAPGRPNHFELRMETAPAGDFDVTDGFVLVTEASNDRLLGSVFAREAWRPHAPVPVPQTFDPPLNFRFRLDN